MPETTAEDVARRLSSAIDAAHPASWYADFKTETHHYVIFKDKVFLIDRREAAQYLAAQQYGIARGLPPHQVDFVALFD